MKITLLTIILSAAIFSFPFRVDQLPSSKFGCVSCHIDFGGNEELTPFGEDAQDTFNGANVDWSRLAALDSDGDGATNGEEFGDPEGTWKPGDEETDPSLVTNPNDPTDFPTSVEAEKIFADLKIGPNPSDNYLSIEFNLKRSGFTKIEIYNVNGELVDYMDYRFRNIGINIFTWNHSLTPSQYYIVLTQNDLVLTKKLIVN